MTSSYLYFQAKLRLFRGETVGVKEEGCNDSKGIGIPCIGTRWRPYAQIIDSTDPTYQIWTRQSPFPGVNGDGNSEDGSGAAAK